MCVCVFVQAGGRMINLHGCRTHAGDLMMMMLI